MRFRWEDVKTEMLDPSYSQTVTELNKIGDTTFEQLVLFYIEYRYPEMRGIIHSGMNEEGKPIVCPVDGVYYLAGPPPRYISVQCTTIGRQKLRTKWLGGKKEPGDLPKAIAEFHDWRTGQPDSHGLLFLATNRPLVEVTSLYKDAIQRGYAAGLEVRIIEASPLLRFLTMTREGHFIRDKLLQIPANRLSRDLLRQLSRNSLDQHWSYFGRDDMSVSALIGRDIMPELRDLVAGTLGLIGITGPSGVGKTCIAQQLARERLSEGDFVLWIPAELIDKNTTLVATLTATLQQLRPSLDSSAGEEALHLITEQANRLLLLVDDVNRTGSSSRLLRTLEGWVRQGHSETNIGEGSITLLVPLWPSEVIQLTARNHDNILAVWQFKSVNAYSEGERTVFSTQQQGLNSLDLERVAQTLGGDPFLCGLVTPRLRTSPDMTRAELTRRIFEGVIDQAALETEERARSAGLLVTTHNVATAIDQLIELMLHSDQPDIDWQQVLDLQNPRQVDILHHLAASNQIGWLESDRQRTTWRWKHTRLRDALLGRWLARRVDDEWQTGTVSEQTLTWLRHPGLSEAWALSLIFLPVETAQVKMIQLLSMEAPLVLAHTLRLGLFPQEQGLRQAIQEALAPTLAYLPDRENEFVAGLETLILGQLAVTDDPLVLSLTQGLPDDWDVRFARLRNGDIEVAIRVFNDRLKREEFPPFTHFATLEEALQACSRNYAGKEQELIERLSQLLANQIEVNAVILLMGYLAWPQFSDMICSSWQDRRQVWERKEEGGYWTWLCHLWAIGRCCTPESTPVLEELLLMAGDLSDVYKPGEHGSERQRYFSQPMQGAGKKRLPMSSTAAETWAAVASRTPAISRSLFDICRYIEDPHVVEAYVRWHAVTKPFYTHEFSRDADVLRDPQPLPQDHWPETPVFQSKAVLGCLWDLVTKETDPSVREIAFAIWKRSASQAELSQLQSIAEDDTLFSEALAVRVRLSDVTAGPALAKKMEAEPGIWCGYAPRLYRVPEVRAAFLENYASALQENEWEEGYAPRHLPVEAVPEFIERLRPNLLQTPRTWTALLQTNVPQALQLVQHAIAEAPEGSFAYLFSPSALYGGPALTERMLAALMPVIHKLSESDIVHLIEQAVRDGHSVWIEQNLREYVYTPDHPKLWLTEVDMTESLNALAERVPGGYMAVRATHYYMFVIDSESSRGVMKEPLEVIQKWLGSAPSDNQIIVAAVALAERGQAVDIEWWEGLALDEHGEASWREWINALRLLRIRKWNG